ncbi:MAG: methyltransferase domain-containing protein [Elusimicrobia bacterium]|nr:methyltransferase domain-containing protein [Elusimicrobiota bacterium]
MAKEKLLDSKPEIAASPQRIVDLWFGYAPTMVLVTAVQLDVFGTMTEGAQTAADVAKATNTSPRGMTMLLDALVSLGLLEKQANRYDLTPESETYLVKSSDGYLGGFFEMFQKGVHDWLKLPEAVRSGAPVRSVEHQKRSEEFFPPLIRALHVANMGPAHGLARKLGLGTRWRGLRVLDVAAGSGVWGIAAAQEDPSTTVAALDFPKILTIAREYAAKAGVADRMSYLETDMRDATFEDNTYDLVILGNICHAEGADATREFLTRVQPAIRPNGKLAIVDMIPNEERTEPPFPLLFALQMLLHTTQGGTFTQSEYTRWLQEAGFKKVEAVDIRFHSPIIVASR